MSLRRPLLITWMTTMLLASPVAARAQTGESGTLQDALKSAAEEILKVVKDQPISVGQFTGTGLPDANGGAAINALLRQAVEAIRPGAIKARGAAFEVKGDYNLAPHPDKSEADQGQKIIRLVFRIIDSGTFEEIPLKLTRFIRDNTTIARLLGVSGPLPLDPAKTQPEQRRERNKEIQKQVTDPSVFVDPARPSLVSSKPGSPFRVEILAGPLGDGKTRPTQARAAKVVDGLAFVGVDRSEICEVVVHNESSEEIAAAIFIDGLTVFHFSDDRDPKDSSKPRYGHFIVPAGGSLAVAGWHKSVQGPDNFLAFLVTAYGEGASSKAGIPAQGPVGVIQVQFSKCQVVDPKIGKRSPSNEMGFGPPRQVGQEEAFREIEPPIDSVSVRYTR